MDQPWWISLPATALSKYLAERAAADEAQQALLLADVAVWRLDLASGKVYGNQVCFDRMRREPSDIGLDHAWVLSQYHPDDQALALQANERALGGDAAVDAILRYRYADGEPYRTLLTRRVARRDAQGQPTELIGVALDIGDNVRLSEEAREATRRTAEIETLVGVGCWTLCPASGRAEWDAGLFAVHGREPVRGTPGYQEWVEAYVHPDDRPRLRGALALQAHVLRKPYTDDCRIVRGDGQVRFLKITGHYADGPEGIIICGTMADVTDQRSVSDALRVEQAHTRFASEAAGVGAWECSLRGDPLYWNAQMYRLHGLDPHDARPLSQLWAAAHRPVDMAQLRRAIRRHVEEKQPLEHELRTLWPDGSEHWIMVRGRVMPGPAGRGERVFGVCWDLTDRRHIERKLSEKEAALSDIRARHDHVAHWAESLRTALLDFGQHTASDLLAKAEQLVGALRGRLPHDDEPAVPVPADAPPVLRPLTLVCIDNSAVNLMVVEQLVQLRPNLTLHSASSSQAGIALALQVHADVVLLDMNLPDGDGIAVLRRLREQPALAGAACIVVSASALQSDIDRALAAGFDAYCTKPIDREVFLATLDALSQGQAPGPALPRQYDNDGAAAAAHQEGASATAAR